MLTRTEREETKVERRGEEEVGRGVREGSEERLRDAASEMFDPKPSPICLTVIPLLL